MQIAKDVWWTPMVNCELPLKSLLSFSAMDTQGDNLNEMPRVFACLISANQKYTKI